MNHCRQLVFGACVAGLVLGAAQTASALTIVRNFSGGSASGGSAGAGTLEDIFNAAADCWQHHILDNHTVTISFGWGSLGSGVLGQHSLGTQGGSPNRETSASILFSNADSFYLDGTPMDSSEWSTLTTSTGNFGGGTLTSGRVYTGASGLASGRYDLFSVALHEIGHALGMSGANTSFIAENGDGDIDITAPLPFAGSTFSTTLGAHINVGTTLMFPSISSGIRRQITDIDILANAQISQFRNLDFSPCAVPEPMTMALSGMCAAAFVRRRVKSKRAAKLPA